MKTKTEQNEDELRVWLSAPTKINNSDNHIKTIKKVVSRIEKDGYPIKIFWADDKYKETQVNYHTKWKQTPFESEYDKLEKHLKSNDYNIEIIMSSLFEFNANVMICINVGGTSKNVNVEFSVVDDSIVEHCVQYLMISANEENSQNRSYRQLEPLPILTKNCKQENILLDNNVSSTLKKWINYYSIKPTRISRKLYTSPQFDFNDFINEIRNIKNTKGHLKEILYGNNPKFLYLGNVQMQLYDKVIKNEKWIDMFTSLDKLPYDKWCSGGFFIGDDELNFVIIGTGTGKSETLFIQKIIEQKNNNVKQIRVLLLDACQWGIRETTERLKNELFGIKIEIESEIIDFMSSEFQNVLIQKATTIFNGDCFHILMIGLTLSNVDNPISVIEQILYAVSPNCTFCFDLSLSKNSIDKNNENSTWITYGSSKYSSDDVFFNWITLHLKIFLNNFTPHKEDVYVTERSIDKNTDYLREKFGFFYNFNNNAQVIESRNFSYDDDSIERVDFSLPLLIIHRYDFKEFSDLLKKKITDINSKYLITSSERIENDNTKNKRDIGFFCIKMSS